MKNDPEEFMELSWDSTSAYVSHLLASHFTSNIYGNTLLRSTCQNGNIYIYMILLYFYLKMAFLINHINQCLYDLGVSAHQAF